MTFMKIRTCLLSGLMNSFKLHQKKTTMLNEAETHKIIDAQSDDLEVSFVPMAAVSDIREEIMDPQKNFARSQKRLYKLR